MTVQKIAFQGFPGAYSDMACRAVFADMTSVPCNDFDSAFRAVTEGKAELAMIPVDNTLAGRVADVHHLLPKSGLYIIGEHFQPIEHALLALPGTHEKQLKYVHSHIHALPQCRDLIARRKLLPIVEADTAGAAKMISEQKDPARAAIASPLAAELYGLDIIEENVQDADHNTTRFLILSPQPRIPDIEETPHVLTSLMFDVRNIPAALYKALGGFATNGVNFAKLESYVDERFQAAQFYVDIEGHPDSRHVALALEELRFFARNIKIFGTYPMHPFRFKV